MHMYRTKLCNTNSCSKFKGGIASANNSLRAMNAIECNKNQNTKQIKAEKLVKMRKIETNKMIRLGLSTKCRITKKYVQYLCEIVFDCRLHV